jgi:two-component system, OmpR family, sensor kinase
MSLRLRLLLATGAAALLALVGTDLATYSSLQGYLYGQIDQQLELTHPGIESALDSGAPLTQGLVAENAPGTFAEVRTSSGTTIGAPIRAFSGASGRFLPVPQVPSTIAGLGDQSSPKGSSPTSPPATAGATAQGGGAPPPGGGGPARGEPAVYLTTASASGGPAYRLRVSLLSDGRQLVLGLPLTATDATLAHLVKVELLVTGGALLLAVLVGWWLVHIGLRPLIEVESAAEDVAGGELGRRVPVGNPSTEVGRLARVLNVMLGRIEEAFSARDRTEADLRDSEARMRRFLADASHELRTPLTAVTAYAELFEAGADERPEDLARVLSGIRRETARMGDLVADLLLLARLDEARPLSLQPTELVLSAAHAVDAARAVEPGWPVTLAASHPIEVEADEVRIRQVMDNLLANVRAHTPRGTETVLTISDDGGHAVIEVADNGPGLSDEQLQRVFDRFYRGDSSRSRDSGGSGLGLAIVRAIVLKHGGTVEVANGSGRGAVFTVRLPLISELAGSGPPAAAVKEPHQSAK